MQSHQTQAKHQPKEKSMRIYAFYLLAVVALMAVSSAHAETVPGSAAVIVEYGRPGHLWSVLQEVFSRMW
jgi:hypothetical protein